MSKTYNNNSIRSLKGAERVRKRPGVIFGADNIEGTQHSVFEILSNSTDEAKAGYGKHIILKRHKDHSITVQDFGRGIPLDYNTEEERYNWELVYCELYAGGKYDDDSYKYSLGLNGLGACATQYASEFFDVTVIRDGYEYSLHFEKGENIGGLKKKKIKNKNIQTGTCQHWKPDIEVFTEIEIDTNYLQEMLDSQAMINKGIEFQFIDEIENIDKTYYYENGILDFINNKIANSKTLLTEPYLFEDEGVGKDREDKNEYKVKAEIVFCFDNSIHNIKYYHNSSYLEHGGSPDLAIKKGFVTVLDNFIKTKNKYNKNETKITFEDVSDSLLLIVNSASTETSYENQTKKAIRNKFIKDFIYDMVKKHLEVWLLEHGIEANKIVDQVLANKRSREKADEQRKILKNKLSGNSSSWDRVKKFVDCKEKNPALKELFIVEGE